MNEIKKKVINETISIEWRVCIFSQNFIFWDFLDNKTGIILSIFFIMRFCIWHDITESSICSFVYTEQLQRKLFVGWENKRWGICLVEIRKKTKLMTYS